MSKEGRAQDLMHDCEPIELARYVLEGWEMEATLKRRITELEAGLLRALHVINGEFSHGPDDDLTIDEWVTDE